MLQTHLNVIPEKAIPRNSISIAFITMKIYSIYQTPSSSFPFRVPSLASWLWAFTFKVLKPIILDLYSSL